MIKLISNILDTISRAFSLIEIKIYEDNNSFCSPEFLAILRNKEDRKKIDDAIDQLKSGEVSSIEIKLSNGETKILSI